MENVFLRKDNKKLILIVILFLVILTLVTKYSWSADKEDYSDVAKFFAGEYSAKIRSSHSYLFGFIHTPLIWLINNFIIFKITSLIFLLLIIYSVYYITKKDKRALWLMLLSPIIWYIAPWANPIQLAALIFLWAYYFINKYDQENKIQHLLYSGALIGLAWAVWDPIIFFGFFLALSFLYNKKFYHIIYFTSFVLIGLSPRLILDQYLFNFPFYTILKNLFGTWVTLNGGIYNRTLKYTQKNFINILLVIISIPLMYWRSYKPKNLIKNKKTLIFLSLSLFLMFMTPQIRYTLIIVPIMILLITKEINEKQFKKQIIFSIIILTLFISPYIIQINQSGGNQVGGVEINYLLNNRLDFGFDNIWSEDLIKQNLDEIINNYPNQVFVVGNTADRYQILANLYWGSNVKEFVSIQDYNLAIQNKTLLYEKKFMPSPNIADRRQIWLVGGINKNENDDTDYESIEFGIGINEPIDIEGFVVIERYDRLYLSKKIKS